MKTIWTSIVSRLRTKTGKAVVAVIIATLVLRYPVLTAWMDAMLRDFVMKGADGIRTLALPIIILFFKQFNETGGTIPITQEAADRAMPLTPKTPTP